MDYSVKGLGGNAQNHARGLTAALWPLQTQNKIMTPQTAAELPTTAVPTGNNSQAVAMAADAAAAANRHAKALPDIVCTLLEIVLDWQTRHLPVGAGPMQLYARSACRWPAHTRTKPDPLN